MEDPHSLKDRQQFHHEAMHFFASQLALLKDVVPMVKSDRLAKAAMLLINCGSTGAAILQLTSQVNFYSNEVMMLARSFMETTINFCYVVLCDESEYRAFLLHPVYKSYHNVGKQKMEEYFKNDYNEKKLKEKQEKLGDFPIVQEALAMFSETKSNLNWSRKKLDEKIEIIKERGKLMDVFFTISKARYYSNASEILHGSLYGSAMGIGFFERGFDYNDGEKINKRSYKENTIVLLHLGMLVHEIFSVISHTEDIEELWRNSYNNRNLALNLLFNSLGIQLEDRNSKE